MLYHNKATIPYPKPNQLKRNHRNYTPHKQIEELIMSSQLPTKHYPPSAETADGSSAPNPKVWFLQWLIDTRQILFINPLVSSDHCHIEPYFWCDNPLSHIMQFDAYCYIHWRRSSVHGISAHACLRFWSCIQAKLQDYIPWVRLSRWPTNQGSFRLLP